MTNEYALNTVGETAAKDFTMKKYYIRQCFRFRAWSTVLCLILVSGLALGNEDEWKRLEAGEVLVTEASIKGLDNKPHLRGKVVALIDAPPLEVWKTIMDHNHFAEFMPSLDECSIKEDVGKSRLVSYHVKIGWVDIRYHLRLVYDQENWHVDYSLDKAFRHDIDDSQGTWDLEPISDGERTKVIYSVYIDSGRFVPDFIEHALSKRQLPGILRNVRNRTISGGTWEKGDPDPARPPSKQ